MKIVLIGYMGSGKSTVARELARELDLPFTDLDDYITASEKLSIKEIFETKGEIYFRLQESKYLKQLLAGGTPCYGDNMEVIKEASRSFYLKAGIKTICQRLRNEKAQRPLIASLDEEQLNEFVAKHLFERRNFYEQAGVIISVDNKSVTELVHELLDIIQR